MSFRAQHMGIRHHGGRSVYTPCCCGYHIGWHACCHHRPPYIKVGGLSCGRVHSQHGWLRGVSFHQGVATPLFVSCVAALAIKSKRTYQVCEQASCLCEKVCRFDSDSRRNMFNQLNQIEMYTICVLAMSCGVLGSLAGLHYMARH